MPRTDQSIPIRDGGRPIRLRGHHILCLHGFRGLGYSPEFATNMWLIRDTLRASPDGEVELLDSADDICAACPHLSEGGCARNGEESEKRTSDKDAAVLRRLSMSPGDRVAAGALFKRAADVFREGNIEDVCGSCHWYPLGWCALGLRDRVMG